jgi:3-dehydroquinate dehydratase II
MKQFKFKLINGPNLDLLGKRERDLYGDLSLNGINALISNEFKDLPVSIDFFQSNEEGKIITEIGNCIDKYDGLIINPGAYSHYSIAILDAIRSINIPVIEVHLTNIFSRENYRKNSVTAEGCLAVISGLGYAGYIFAIKALIMKEGI